MSKIRAMIALQNEARALAARFNRALRACGEARDMKKVNARFTLSVHRV